MIGRISIKSTFMVQMMIKPKCHILELHVVYLQRCLEVLNFKIFLTFLCSKSHRLSMSHFAQAANQIKVSFTTSSCFDGNRGRNVGTTHHTAELVAFIILCPFFSTVNPKPPLPLGFFLPHPGGQHRSVVHAALLHRHTSMFCSDTSLSDLQSGRKCVSPISF